MKGEIVKKGRSIVAGEVFFYDAETMAPVAYSYLTFMGSPRPQDRPPAFTRGMRTVGTMEEMVKFTTALGQVLKEGPVAGAKA